MTPDLAGCEVTLRSLSSRVVGGVAESDECRQPAETEEYILPSTKSNTSTTRTYIREPAVNLSPAGVSGHILCHKTGPSPSFDAVNAGKASTDVLQDLLNESRLSSQGHLLLARAQVEWRF